MRGWSGLKSRKRPARLLDDVHHNWEVEARVPDRYERLIHVTLTFQERQRIELGVNASGEVVSRRVIDAG